MIIAPVRARRTLAAALAVLGTVALACGGGGGGRGGSPTGPGSPATRTVRITSGGALLGVELEIHHAVTTTVTDVAPAGGLAAATCEENVQPGLLRAACVRSTPVTAPFDAWTIAFSQPGDGPEILALTCRGADSSGARFVVSCTMQ